MRTTRQRLGRSTAMLLLAGIAASPTLAHPRLLIDAADVARIRHACGVGDPVEESGMRFGLYAHAYQNLRAHFVERPAGPVLPGETLAAAFLHVVAPTDRGDSRRVDVVAAALRDPASLIDNPLEKVVALDWTWDALPASVRTDFLLKLREKIDPLGPKDSPLEHSVFRRKLVSLALALAVNPADEPGASWREEREKIIAAARTYFQTTFPRFVTWRGLAPTGPAVAADVESDTVLALELARRALDENVWERYRDSVGRWMEHYVFASLSHPAVQHHFLRDDGSAAPLTPAPDWNAMHPLTAQLIAARTEDPAAAFVARRVAQRMRGPAASPLAGMWQWVPAAFDAHHVPLCDFAKLPPARNLGGAVVFRGGTPPLENAIWIEAGQPFLRRRQHFDAGHFLIYGGGHLVVRGGDDVALEAIAPKGGAQHLGRESLPFDFEQYFVATIAHNAIVFSDPAHVERWYGDRFLPVGGQRAIEYTCTDFATPPEMQQRQTARQLAFGTHHDHAYLALDLAPAYHPDLTRQYTREYLYLDGNLLLVIDRLKPHRKRATPHWLLNIPSRPQIDNDDLQRARSVAGTTNDAGIWRYPGSSWVRWQNHDGSCLFKTLLPEDAELRVVGGPAKKNTIDAGPYDGQKYIGGAADSFERLIVPSTHYQPRNAWYKLGRPTLLGEQFGHVDHWGRIEVVPENEPRLVMVNLLVLNPPKDDRTPEISMQRNTRHIQIGIVRGRQRMELTLPRSGETGGMLRIMPGDQTWKLPKNVQPSTTLPLQNGEDP